MNTSAMKPEQVRLMIRKGEITGPTPGMCSGYAQGNLVVLPKDLAYDFLLFTQRNPKSCPLLEVSDTGSRCFSRTVSSRFWLGIGHSSFLTAGSNLKQKK